MSAAALLGESSLEIASVVRTITAIAEQTNLLALNATIEAAATTTEMNRNVAEAAQSAGQIVDNITAVAGAATATTRAMTDARTAMDEVARMASALSASVQRFRY